MKQSIYDALQLAFLSVLSIKVYIWLSFHSSGFTFLLIHPSVCVVHLK